MLERTFYSLGVMLFLVLTERLPFSGSVGDILERQLKIGMGGEPLPRARGYARGVPASLDDLCARAMELPAYRRLASAQEVVQGIDAFLALTSASPPVRSRFEWTPMAEQKAFAERTGQKVCFANAISMEFVLVPPGQFLMGSPESEQGRYDDEGPRHEVTISNGFYLARTAVTNRHYRLFRPAHHTPAFRGEPLDGDEQPVANVSWDDAQAFCAWLGGREGVAVRLPTEVEWEYACRAGTTASRYWGEDEAVTGNYANVADLTLKKKWPGWSNPVMQTDDGYVAASPVASFEPNRFGLYDMIGNVWEWCQDGKRSYSQDAVVDPRGPDSGNRSFRGGSWTGGSRNCRAAFRNFGAPSGIREQYLLGFRVAVTPRVTAPFS